MKFHIAIIVALCLLGWFEVAHADEIFPPTLQTREGKLIQCSQAEIKAFNLFEVGNAALYLDNCINSGDIFSKSPKQLRLVYSKAIPGKAFKEGVEEYLKINLGERYPGWEQAFNDFDSHYRDIKEGDYYDLVFDPQTGLQLFLNKKLLGTLQDIEQALAYFNVWFGKEPFSEELKNELLKTG